MTLRSGWLEARVAGSRPRRESSRVAGRRRSGMVEDDGPVASRGSSEDGRQNRGTCWIPVHAEPNYALHYAALDDKATAQLLWICCCGEGLGSVQRSGWELVLAGDGGEPTETCGRFGRVKYKPLPESGW